MMSYKQEIETRLNNGAEKYSEITEKSVAAAKADAKGQEPLCVKLESEGKKTAYRYTERGKEILLAAY